MSSSTEVPNIECVNVNFACQRCCQPLKMQSTLSTINEQIVKELTNETAHESDNIVIKTSSLCHPCVTYKVIPPLRLTDSSSNGNGFLLIGESGVSLSSSGPNNGSEKSPSKANANKLSHQMKMSSRLFDILSEQSDVDHPLCEECADFVIDQMDHELRLLEDECRDYRDYNEALERAEDSHSDLEEIEKLKDRLTNLQSLEQQLIEELKQTQDEQKQIDTEIEKQNNELQRLFHEEDRYWHEYNNLRSNVFSYDDEQQSVDNQLRYAQSQLDKLKRTDVFNATFHIWHNGQFGTINNFRLGRLPNVTVEWTEINAAWGQAALLLYSLAKKINLTFQRYKLVPYGSHSFLESLEDKSKQLPLYASGGFRYFWNSKFDQAMVAFLDCLQQFKEEVERGDSGFCLPYKMEKGKIEDTKTGNTYSVKIQFNSEEQWTKALKFMLTNLKWALAWVSSQFNNKT